MTTLRIEHLTANFENWKRSFDADPADRKGSGVRRYRITRAVADPNLVQIDLDFDDLGAAEVMLTKLQQVWAGPAVDIVSNAKGTILEGVESAEV